MTYSTHPLGSGRLRSFIASQGRAAMRKMAAVQDRSCQFLRSLWWSLSSHAEIRRRLELTTDLTGSSF